MGRSVLDEPHLNDERTALDERIAIADRGRRRPRTGGRAAAGTARDTVA